MKRLTKVQKRVFSEIKDAVSENKGYDEGECTWQVTNYWNRRTIDSLVKLGLIKVCGDVIEVK